ncbi:MAG: GNAT family N-acetyltransferase [Oscillospiraceae bacterium]|nr:GNAT family N-acetyltransferase [Oscillospiraceae bacterium]
MEIRQITLDDAPAIAPLVALFRVELRSYKGASSEPDEAAGRAEIEEYLAADWPVFAAVEDGSILGYLVCRVEEPCVWAESLYVRPEYRRRGVAGALYARAEALAASYGEDTVYNYVHPNNDGVIAFLKSRGYSVLNLIELRKPWKGETPRTKISVGGHEFDY